MKITRRTLMKAAAAASVLPAPALAQGTRTLRYVPASNLTVLDPVFTPAAVSITHGYLVFDTLFGVDDTFTPRPQMAEGAEVSDNGLEWRIRLRDGLTFHDGEPVRAQDAAASLARWSKRDTFGQTLGAAVDSWGHADDRTVVIKLKRPFGRLLDAIAKPHSSPAMIMPERLASQDISQQVTEMVGSGPYRFVADEYISGDRVVYQRFEGYQPRQEAASWTAGGKVAHFDRVEWRVLPDQATRVAALQSGEVDWVDTVIADLHPILEAHPDIRMHRIDPFGKIAVIRFNHVQPPFDNVALRRAILKAIDQTPYLQAIAGNDPNAGQRCLAAFPCGMPGVTELGAGMLPQPPDLDAARAEIAASGYNGERVVILNPTDIASIHPHGLITADLLTRLGMNVDLQETDWGTVVQRRVSREPVDSGGWSIAHTNWPSISIANPATNATIRGQGDTGWWGWFKDERIEQLTEDWLAAASPAAAQEAFDAVHARALDQVPSVPLGQFFDSGAVRADIEGALQGSVAYFWNVRRA